MPRKPLPAEFEWIGGKPVVCCVRTGLGSLIDPGYFGQLTFRCPWCGKVHVHGAVGPKLGDGDGERIPACPEKPQLVFAYELREVKYASQAGTLRKDHLADFEKFKKAGFRIPDSWHRRRPKRDGERRN